MSDAAVSPSYSHDYLYSSNRNCLFIIGYEAYDILFLFNLIMNVQILCFGIFTTGISMPTSRVRDENSLFNRTSDQQVGKLSYKLLF